MLHFKWLLAMLLAVGAGTLVAAPVNDNFADRIVVSSAPVTVVGTTVDGTIEPGEPPAFHILSTVWYEWVAPRPGRVRVRIDGSPNSVVVHMYSGTILDGLERVGWINSNFEGNIDVQEGVAYQFQIGPDQPVPWPRFEGPFTLRLEYNAPPPNDHFTNRIRLTNRIERISFRNVLATLEPGEELLSVGGYSVWYQWRAPETGMAHILMDNSYNTVVGVYGGSQDSVGTLITNSQIGGGHCWDEVTFPVVAGGFYQIAFDNCSGTPGDHALTLTLNGAARLDGPKRRPDGVMELKLYGERYRTYLLQASSNLANWTPISTNFYYNSVLIEDAEALLHAQRFYRLELSQ